MQRLSALRAVTQAEGAGGTAAGSWAFLLTGPDFKEIVILRSLTILFVKLVTIVPSLLGWLQYSLITHETGTELTTLWGESQLCPVASPAGAADMILLLCLRLFLLLLQIPGGWQPRPCCSLAQSPWLRSLSPPDKVPGQYVSRGPPLRS